MHPRREREVFRFGVILVVVGAAALGALSVAAGAAADGSADSIEFADVRQQSREFIEYYHAITLTPEQEAIKREALSALPAPCCSDNSAYTCCCPCNMAKTWWGLAAHLIVDKGHDAERVRDKVAEWIEVINPDGFSGDACYTRGCFRPFRENGCGGMHDEEVIF